VVLSKDFLEAIERIFKNFNKKLRDELKNLPIFNNHFDVLILRVTLMLLNRCNNQGRRIEYQQILYLNFITPKYLQNSK
jgi:hypothetical protein